MTIVCYEKKNSHNTIASIEREKYCSSYILFVCDVYGRTIKKSYYSNIKSAKQAGNRTMLQFDGEKEGTWKKIEQWTIINRGK